MKNIKCKYCGGPLIFVRVHERERVQEYYCQKCKSGNYQDEKGEIL